MKLTQKQETFCTEYFKTRDAMQSAVMAGYSPKSVTCTAYRLLDNARISSRLDELNKKAEDDSIATVQERQRILTEIARGNLIDYQEVGADGGYLNIDKKSPNTRAISEITSRTEYDKDGSGAALVTKVKLHSTTQAIDLLNKMDKIYSDAPPSGNTYNIGAMQVNVGDPKEKLLGIINRLAARAGEVESDTGPNG